MEIRDVRLALVFKDFAAWCQSSTVGLNVAGFATSEVLNQHGINTTVIPVRHNIDVVDGINQYNAERDQPLTHVVISAPWLSRHDLKCLIEHFDTIQFAILSHSNVGFLQADPCGVELIKHYLTLTEDHDNLAVGANSEKLFDWLQNTIGGDTVLLPNLYPLKRPKSEKHWFGASPLRIGAFGAVRPEKNFMTAAAAAVALQKMTGAEIELHMSSGGEGGGESTVAAITELCAGNPQITLIRHGWCLWPEFIQLVGSMDLLLQPSYTESFNMITADGVLMGVPSVVSHAIDWAPDEWKANSDNAMSVAEVGLRLLKYGNYGEGKRALEKHNREAIHYWIEYLKDSPQNVLGRLFDRLRNAFM
jgi:hypothetical protein